MNVLEGPSVLLLFFEEAVNLTRADGSAVLERGDTVIMDNCGFHHGHLVEPILTALLANCGVRLLFQPPYSPEFNTCELCFHDIKRALATKSALRLHSLCMLQGGGGDFFFSAARFFISPPQGPYKFSEPPQAISRKMNTPPPSPLTRNIKINICIIVRDMFNKNIERALTVYVIPMPASLSSAN